VTAKSRTFRQLHRPRRASVTASVVSRFSLAVQAVRVKLQLLRAYDTFWPAAVRGGRLLLQGRLRDFTRKLFNELPDTCATIPVTAARTGPHLFLAGHVLGLGGYDHLVLNVLKGLTEAGVHVCADPRACFRKQLVPLELRPTPRRRKRSHPRLAIAPPHLLRRFRPDQRTAAFTMWETDTLPADGVTQLNRCGLVLVPSRWGAECIRANGVTVPIEVVPLGHDPEVFHAKANQPALRQCTFGTAGALDEGGLRKNVQQVIDLFRQAFPTRSDVRLRVKITPNSPPVNTSGDPRIDVIDSHLSPTELAEWYGSLSAFVNASAGEGFGLHLLEAMACGVPLISARFGAVGSYFDSRVGYEVGYRLVEARNAVYQGLWSDPDPADLIARMREVYADGEQARRLGQAAAQRARRFRWEDTLRRLVVALIRHRFIAPRRSP
jgi:glycosyltransferase involved in cell wall biosynthesis